MTNLQKFKDFLTQDELRKISQQKKITEADVVMAELLSSSETVQCTLKRHYQQKENVEKSIVITKKKMTNAIAYNKYCVGIIQGITDKLPVEEEEEEEELVVLEEEEEEVVVLEEEEEEVVVLEREVQEEEEEEQEEEVVVLNREVQKEQEGEEEEEEEAEEEAEEVFCATFSLKGCDSKLNAPGCCCCCSCCCCCCCCSSGDRSGGGR
jgi:hypothetical protein